MRIINIHVFIFVVSRKMPAIRCQFSSIVNLRCGAEFYFIFLALQSLGVEIAILRVLRFLDVMYSHWEQCREVIEESVECVCVCVNCYRLNFFLKCVEKVVVFLYISRC